jgi:hypothetical protein
MKKIMCALVAAAGVVLVLAMPVYARHGHWGGSIWIGPGWGPIYPYPPVYPYPFYVGPPAVVQRPIIIQESPPIYVEQAPSRDGESYWYYCPDPQGYYPYVKRCPKGWERVAPSPEPMNEEE